MRQLRAPRARIRGSRRCRSGSRIDADRPTSMPNTRRLYYNAPDTQSFEATVLRVKPRGEHTSEWLDQTAFYPTSGGQPFDTGILGSAPVVGVEEDEHGDVAHLVGPGAPTVGTAVHGTIDWGRRFDHMQQHTGQHVLSAVLERTF